jgi:hypothetical protein
MKKLFFIAAIAAAALVSCTKNEFATSVTEQQEISFAAPVMSPTTKVAEIANDYPNDPDSKFAVWAHYYTGDYTNFAAGKRYMNDVTVGYDATVEGWKNATPYYWPKNGTLTFIAYSPSSVQNAAKTAVGVDANGIKFTDYTVGDPSTQVDLLFSERAYNKTEVDRTTEDADPYAGVQINFKHALSSILFKVKAAETYAGTTLKVTKVEILNAYSKGSFSQGLTDANSAETADANTVPGWTNQDVETTYVAYDNATGIELHATDVKYLHSGSTALTANTTDLILLPQALNHTSTSKEVTVRVTYTLKNADMADPITQVGEVKLATGNAGGYFGGIESWQRGKRYIYTISVGLEEIYFDPQVTGWEPVSITPELSI